MIGAGLAGLAAAYRLSEKNYKVTVLEGRERLGGRVLTHRFCEAPGLSCELGGEWIGKNHKLMRGLCKELKLGLQLHQYANSFWNQLTPARLIPPGGWCLSAEAQAIWTKFQEDFKNFGIKRQRKMDRIDWWTQLKELGFGPDDLLRRDMMDSTDFGETIRMNSAFSAATEYLSSKGEKVDDSDEMDFKIRGGNSRLVNALARKIGFGNIKTEQIVVGIRQREKAGDKKVHVYVEGANRPIDADYCVCAIPAHCMVDIDWGKRPPKHQLEAASELQYARITKTAVLCSKRFWPKPERGGFSVCTNLASDFCFDSTYGQDERKTPWATGRGYRFVSPGQAEVLDCRRRSQRTRAELELRAKQGSRFGDPAASLAGGFVHPGRLRILSSRAVVHGVPCAQETLRPSILCRRAHR